MNLSDPQVLMLATARIRALTSISRHNNRVGYERAGFTFAQRVDGIHLSHSEAVVAVMSRGFTRDDVCRSLHDSVKEHYVLIDQLFARELRRRLVVADGVSACGCFEREVDDLVSTEKRCLDFRVLGTMGRPYGLVRLFAMEGHLMVWPAGHDKGRTVMADTYQALLDGAVDAYNSPVWLETGVA